MVKVLDQKITDEYALYHGDCCEVIAGIPDNSIGYSIYSPPFESLYTYSNSDRDMGNSDDTEQFWNHYKFLIAEHMRTMMPGRLVSIHCMNMPTSKVRDGYIGLRDFRGEIIRAFSGSDASDLYIAMKALRNRAITAMNCGDNSRALKLNDIADSMDSELQSHPGDSGFIYHSEVVIWKDPVTAMQRTKAIGLLHKQLVKDSAMSRQGIPDYLVTFRKPGDNPEPVSGLLSLDEYAGELQGKPKSEGDDVRDSINIWQRYADPVWDDVNMSRTLNYREGRAEEDERHICPLQLDVIERGMQLWSNPGDTVLTPFLGIGSEAYTAVKMNRKAIGIELKESYFELACRNVQSAIDERKQLDMFAC